MYQFGHSNVVMKFDSFRARRNTISGVFHKWNIGGFQCQKLHHICWNNFYSKNTNFYDILTQAQCDSCPYPDSVHHSISLEKFTVHGSEENSAREVAFHTGDKSSLCLLCTTHIVPGSCTISSVHSLYGHVWKGGHVVLA